MIPAFKFFSYFPLFLKMCNPLLQIKAMAEVMKKKYNFIGQYLNNGRCETILQDKLFILIQSLFLRRPMSYSV